ncbi:MAG TPA: hypothetical protein VIE67_00890 [Rudaea sp.]|jgi:hypothetical protein|uniref:hypothetical protein n=1 Tax=Rudaea sp. TaxID=2136325 RepID=UPI002F92A544
MRSMLFFAFIFALFVPGFATAASGVTITLDVRNFPTNGSDGYTDTTASNGHVYSYKYSGGNGKKGGDVEFDKADGHNTTVVLHLHSDARYTINNVAFPVDPNSQLSQPNPHAPTTATIQDKNEVVQTATYKVSVKDSTANTTFPCDPQIINK